MSETVVHVSTLEQWNSVLDVWFEQGYKWNTGDTEYSYYLFTGHKYLVLQFFEGSHYIHCADEGLKSIEYSEFMAQQKEDKEVKTYYVTQEQLDLIKDLKEGDWPLSRLVNSQNIFRPLNEGLKMIEEKSLLRYLGGDETIEFKVKEQLYRLWRIDDNGDKVYLEFIYGTPAFTRSKKLASSVSLNETQKWINPAWEIEKAD